MSASFGSQKMSNLESKMLEQEVFKAVYRSNTLNCINFIDKLWFRQFRTKFFTVDLFDLALLTVQ